MNDTMYGRERAKMAELSAAEMDGAVGGAGDHDDHCQEQSGVKWLGCEAGYHAKKLYDRL